MSQLRLDPLTGRWTVISPRRGDRPHAFLTRSLPVETEETRICPFCPGEPQAPAPVLEARDESGQWQVRVLPNLYPAFTGSEPMAVSHLGPVFTQATASGVHEVLVLSPLHDLDWAELPPEQAGLAMRVLRDRVDQHASEPGLRYTQAIVNYGREAGASLEHPHAQLLGMPFVPGEIVSEQAGFARFKGNCLLCTTVQAEGEAGHRVVHEDDTALAVCPFWSGTPFEVMIIPKTHQPHLHLGAPDDVGSIGATLSEVLQRVRSAIGNVAYNVVFHSAPYRSTGEFHWHIHVLPKVTTRAGFELGTGVLINVVPPEHAARELRAVELATTG